MDTKLLEELTVKLMKENNVTIDSGAQFSVKCQYAQIENIVRGVVDEMIDSAISKMQSSYSTDKFNGRGDGGQPLICLTSALGSVVNFLET